VVDLVSSCHLSKIGEIDMASKSKPKTNYIPTDYEDLYRYYVLGDGNGNSLTHQLIRSMMPYATPDEREVLAHDMFARLLDKGMLEKFDPSKANFGGVIFFVTRTVVANHLNKKTRNPVTGLNGGSLVTKDDDDDFEPGVYSLDRLFAPEQVEMEAALDAKDQVRRLIEWAAAKAKFPENKRDASLHRLIELMAQEFDVRDCARELSVTPSTIRNWIKTLQTRLTSQHGGDEWEGSLA